jgi:hypothetical protein
MLGVFRRRARHVDAIVVAVVVEIVWLLDNEAVVIWSLMPDPGEAFEDTLDALLEVQGAEVDSGHTPIGRKLVDHVDGILDSEVLYKLVVVLSAG